MPKKAAPEDPRRHVLSERFADADLVDRIFDYVVELLPELAERATEVKGAVRDEFGGVEAYIRTGQAQARTERSRELSSQALRLFDGRNATEVARRLQISRATVYRLLKQPGRR